MRFFFDEAKLRVAMAASGHNQVTLGKALGVDQRTVGRWATGKSTDPVRAKAVADMLGVQVDSLHRKGGAPDMRSGVELTPGFPLVPDTPDVIDVIGIEHAASLRFLDHLHAQARAYLKALGDLIDERRTHVIHQLELGALPASGVIAEIRTERRRSSSWKPVAVALAKSKIQCENCGKSTPVVSDPEQWEEQVAEAFPVKEGRRLIIAEE